MRLLVTEIFVCFDKNELICGESYMVWTLEVSNKVHRIHVAFIYLFTFFWIHVAFKCLCIINNLHLLNEEEAVNMKIELLGFCSM